LLKGPELAQGETHTRQRRQMRRARCFRGDGWIALGRRGFPVDRPAHPAGINRQVASCLLLRVPSLAWIGNTRAADRTHTCRPPHGTCARRRYEHFVSRAEWSCAFQTANAKYMGEVQPKQVSLRSHNACLPASLARAKFCVSGRLRVDWLALQAVAL